MTQIDIDKTRKELIESYPGSRVKIAGDNGEMVAEISPEFAVAVIGRSQPHFHLKTREVYTVLRGTLHVACGGEGYVLRKGESITIDPGQIHFAREATGIDKSACVHLKFGKVQSIRALPPAGSAKDCRRGELKTPRERHQLTPL